jgi:hypothetical protein
MKTNITPINVVFFLWVLLQVAIAEIYPNYTRPFLYLSLIIIIPLAIMNLVKQKKEDKLNGSDNFRQSIYRMLIMSIILIVFFYVNK